jgi:transposase InsO family protein
MEFSATLSWLGEERNRNEGIKVFGRAEGVHHQAGRRRNASCGDLPQGGDQLGDLLQLEEEVCRSVAVRDDTFSRYVPVLDVLHSYRDEDVVATVDRVCRTAGYPETIRVDQRSEFVSRDMDLWTYQRGVVLDFSRPGKSTDNAFIEAFNGRFPCGMSEPALVSHPCGRGRRVGGLA